MTNLKEKILQSLGNSKQIENTLNTLTKIKENLLKNYINPVFNEKDKGKLLKSYTDLQDIGKSLYRYNTLQEHNYISYAQEEKENIENKVLKTGISYNKYVWHSENGENTCEECQALDGQVFDYYDEVPQRPHPNCQCTVEIVESEIETGDEDSGEDKKKIPPRVPTPQQPKPTPQPQKWIMPCNGSISSDFGWRKDPITGVKTYHNGWDIKTDIGTPFKAVADGKVIFVGHSDPAGYAHFIVIDHGIVNGKIVTSEYGHISKHYVSFGQKVKQGQIIGATGNEGKSTGPHLHITIREGKYRGIGVNPSIYIQR